MQHTNKIILGTVQFGLPYGINNTTGAPEEQEVFKILDLAYSNNIRTLDTADAYGNAETIIGNYHARHSSFDIISKFKYKEGINLREYILHKTTLLKVQRLYSYMFHSFSDYIRYPQLKKDLLALKEEGLLHKNGVSIYNNEEFRMALQDDKLDLIQLPFNLLDNSNQRGSLLKQARERNIEIHVRSVFLQGLFFKDPANMPDKLKPLSKYITRIREVAGLSGLSLNELALHYVLSNQYIDKVLIGVDSLDQFRSNLSIIQHPSSVNVDELINEITVAETELLNPVNW